MRYSVVVATKDRPALLADTLASLGASEPRPDEVLVVDASEDGASAAVVADCAAAHPQTEFRRMAAERGACRQRNDGIEAARGELVVFLDDDVRFGPGVLARLLEAFDDPAIVGATGRVLEPKVPPLSLKYSAIRRMLPGAGRQGTMTRAGYPNRLWALDEPHLVECMPGCFMAARSEHARAIGFDERLEDATGYALLDDEDFAFRLSQRGRLLYHPRAALEHRNTGYLSSQAREFNRNLVRNRRYTFEKNFPTTTGARALWWIIMGLHVVHRLANRDWEGARGLCDGLRETARGRRA